MGHPVTPLDLEKTGSFVCPHCSYILRDAVQTESGLRLCLSCYKDTKKDPPEKFYEDRAVRREVLQLMVKCKYYIDSGGCRWIGQLQKWEEHCLQCEYKFEPCPHEGCEKELPPGELSLHVPSCHYRVISCDFCHENIQYILLEQHYSTCESYPLECDRCQATVERSKIEEHLRFLCPKEECIICKAMLERETTQELRPDSALVADGGKHPQKSKGQRKHHLHLSHPKSVHQHIQQLSRSQQSVQQDMAALKSVVDQESASLSALRTSLTECKSTKDDVLAKLATLEGVVNEWKSSRDRERDFSSKRLAMEAELERKVKEMFQMATEQNKIISQQREKISSLQQTVQSLQHAQTMDHGRTKLGGAKVHRYQSSEVTDGSRVLEKKVEDLERQVNSLKGFVSNLELQLQASIASTHDGAFLWRVPDMSSRRRDAVNDRITSIYSPPFYTGRNGYKMCVRAYLNGDGSGYNTHLSLFFVLMKGEYDPLLKWPFEYKVSLILIDQNHHRHVIQTFKTSPDSSSFKRPESDMNVASGCPKFAQLSVLDDPNYVKDNTMYIKCIIDTSKIFHP